MASTVTERAQRSKTAFLLLPTGFWMLAFFIVPLLLVAVTSFFAYRNGVIVRTFTLENYQTLFTDVYHLRIFLRSLGIAVGVAATTVVLAVPVAHFLVRSRSRWRSLAFAVVLLPLLASVVVRTYGWLVLLENRGLVNQVLGLFGLGPLEIMHTYTAVFIGLVHVLLPYSILAVMASFHSVHPNVERAAMNLGAGRLQTFWLIILPLVWPGMFTGFVLTFALALTAYATPVILGGSTSPVTATEIYQYMLFLLDWPFASAMAVAVLLITLLLLYLMGRVQQRASQA